MSNFRAFLKCWLPVLIWMAIIFAGSSDPHSYEHSASIVGLFEPLLHWLFPQMSTDTIGEIHHAFRKCCHLGEYAVLALLVRRALNAGKTNLPPWSWPKVGGALLIVFLYGCTDEFHQIFVPTRTPRFADVLIDTTGGALGLLVFWIFQNFRRRPKPMQK